jgi:hypothetical protein
VTNVKLIYLAAIRSPERQFYQDILDRNLLKLWALDINLHCYFNQADMSFIKLKSEKYPEYHPDEGVYYIPCSL